jgi:predicted MFS family arabinose efflux permease
MATQALLALSLGAFWSTLAVTLAGPPFRLGAGLSGAFGLAGAAGALAASLFGRSSDRRGPMLGIRIGGLSVMAAFGGLLLEPDSLWVLVAGTALFDFGVMAAMVSHQSIVARLDRAAQARLNALLVTGAMAGMAAGSWLGFAALAHFGWRGVCAVGLLAGAAGLARSFFR